MNNVTEKFEQLWNTFLTLVRGKLIIAAKSNVLSVGIANQALAEAAEIWRSDYDASGRWLTNLSKENPQVGNLVFGIIRNDMRFIQADAPRTSSPYVDYIISLSAAGAGFGLCQWQHSSKIVTAASTLGLGAVTLVFLSSIRKNKSKKNSQQIIDTYIGQLTKYHDSIVSALQTSTQK